MTTLREAAQQAVTMLKTGMPEYNADDVLEVLEAALAEDAMQKFTNVNQELEAALAEDVVTHGSAWSKDGKRIDPMSVYAEPVQEPVAWMMVNPTHPRLHKSLHWKPQTDWHITWESVPLYVAPPQRKPLREEKISSLFRTAGSPLLFARAIERAHGIT